MQLNKQIYTSLGLKYVQLYFPKKPQNHYENNNRPDVDRQSVVNSAYIRHASVGDYFPGGMDSANTEATLLSRNVSVPGGELIRSRRTKSLHFLNLIERKLIL